MTDDMMNPRAQGEKSSDADLLDEMIGFLKGDAIVRLVRALLIEQDDEWAVPRARYMTRESVGQLSDNPLISLPATERRSASLYRPGNDRQCGDQCRQLIQSVGHHYAT